MLWYCWLGTGIVIGALLTIAGLYVAATVIEADSE